MGCFGEGFLLGEGEQLNTHNSDTPEHLLDRSWESFTRIMCLCGGEPYQFRPRKGKCCVDEDIAESLEAAVECTGINPVLPTYVAPFWISSTVDYDSKNTDILLVG
jgi:hypothetical protein